MKTTEKIIQARAGGAVERCHTVRHQGSYSVAAHSWGVAMLMHYLWPEDFGRLAIHCLSHDVAEAWVGDIPAPVKKFVPGLSHKMADMEHWLEVTLGLPPSSLLGQEDAMKLKVCDCLEFYLWCREQLALGNNFAHDPLEEITRYLLGMGLPDKAMSLFTELQSTDVLPHQGGVMREMNDDEDQ